jgi:hypothetical protein
MTISMSRLGLCSLVNLATGQPLEHRPHWMQSRMPLPRGVLATSPIKPRSNSLNALSPLIYTTSAETKEVGREPNIFLEIYASSLAQTEKSTLKIKVTWNFLL